jgi:uncharacterized protein YndB with AHSA1/START domain
MNLYFVESGAAERSAAMKWIGYILAGVGAIALIAVVVLLALGGGRGHSRLVRTIEIDKPADVVYGWITEPPRLTACVGGLIDIRRDTADPLGVGSREVWIMEDRNNNNERMEIQAEYTRVEPSRLVEARLNVPDGFTGTVIYELQPIDANRTHLTYRSEYQFEHWLAKLLEPVISRSAQQKLNEDLDRMKQKAEAE